MARPEPSGRTDVVATLAPPQPPIASTAATLAIAARRRAMAIPPARLDLQTWGWWRCVDIPRNVLRNPQGKLWLA